MSLKYQLLRYLSDLVVGITNYAIFYLFFSGGSIFSLAQSYYIWTFDSQLRQNDSTIQGKAADWENPEVVGRKRVPIYSTFKSFNLKKDAKRALVDSNRGDNIFMLTGEAGVPDCGKMWKFALAGDPDSLDTAWINSGPTEKSKYNWSDMSLPCHWQLAGFDVPMYTNTSYPFRFNPPYVRRDGTWVNAACDLGLGAVSIDKAPLHPKEPGYNATGLYYRTFVLPSSWLRKSKVSGEHVAEDSQVFLVFEGADSSLAVWVNGIFVGYGQDSCLSSEFDITNALREHIGAEHSVAVRVTRWCDGSYLEDQDKWWLSGIYREVYLIKKPVSRVFDFEVRQEVILGTGETTAKISINVVAEGIVDGQHAVRLEMYESAHSDPVVVQVALVASGSAFPGRLAADAVVESTAADLEPYQLHQPGLATLSYTLQNPTLWSAEKPHLYHIILTLYACKQDAEEGGEGIHSVTSRVGIKHVSIGGADHVLMVNGKPITIAGVNRHEFEPYSGRATSKQCMLEDAKLLKKMNFNAVRSAHYPQHPYWLEVCDEVGFYMIDEANIETHGFQVLGQPVGYLSNLPEWRGAMCARVARMYERDKNHACVIGWSLGNESGFGITHALLKQWLDARDKSRFVQVCNAFMNIFALIAIHFLCCFCCLFI
ncbi:hypothetical protein EON65_00775 [archaeon]|nr:MAG: hypothetical protein EON65_00775 [archaeon]